MSDINGIKYFKLDPPANLKENGDKLINRGLSGSEIDGNFMFLRGNEIDTVSIDKVVEDDKTKLMFVIKKLNGETIEVPMADFVSVGDFNTELTRINQADTDINEMLTKYLTPNYDKESDIRVDINEPEDKGGPVNMKLNIKDDYMFICE